jgi:phosphoglycolate phosphatase
MKHSPLRPCRLFLLDLDGTLIDSRADLTCAVNLALARLRVRPLPESRVTEFVGNGVQILMERALGEAIGREPASNLVQEGIGLFREEYEKHLLDHTHLCHHVKQGLNGLPWARFAVVSNKPESFSRRILEGLGIGKRFCIILGGDSVRRRKPDPEAVFKAMDSCNCSASETAMVGDSPVDIQAGKAAGVTACGILGGFRPREELEAAGCDLIITSLLELADYFGPPE